MRVFVFRTFLLLAGLLCFLLGTPSYGQLFSSRDFTDSLFTSGIEGPAYSDSWNLFVVNFGRNGTIGKSERDGSTQLFFELPEGSIANSIRFMPDGKMVLADYTKHQIWELDPETLKLRSLVYSDRFNQPNDLCVTASGYIFASDPNWTTGKGQVWRLSPDGILALVASLGTANGICLSPDDKRLYVNESKQRKIWVWEVSKTGRIFNRKLFTRFDDFGLDGMKCDTLGNLYVTRHGKGTVAIFNPKGELIREVQLKGKLCSNLEFGGSDRRQVFVTMQDRGCIEVFETDTPGKSY